MPSQDVNALQNIVRCNANAKNVLRTSSGASLVWSKRDTDDAVDADAHSLVRCLAWTCFSSARQTLARRVVCALDRSWPPVTGIFCFVTT